MAPTRLLLAVSLLAFLAACGEDGLRPEPTAEPAWSTVRVTASIPGRPGELAHADRIGGIAEVGNEVVLVAENRLDHWFVVDRDQLVDGAGIVARRIEPTFNESAWVGGRGPLAARAISVGAMKDLPAQVVGLGAWPDGQFALLDRRQRILWSGRLLSGPGGLVRAITFDRATVLPGGDHSGLGEADPRDRSPGVRALAVAPGAPGGVDLMVLEAPRSPEASWRLHRLDRTGAIVKRPLDVPTGSTSTLLALAWAPDGFDAIDREVLQHYIHDPADRLTRTTALALPRMRNLSPWAALARGPSGTTYVGSEFRGVAMGTEADDNRRMYLAWR